MVTKYFKDPDGREREAELFAVPVDPVPAGTDPVPVRSIGRLPGFTEPATGAALSADGKYLAVCSYTVTRVYRRGAASTWDRLAEVSYDHELYEGITWDGRDLILAAERSLKRGTHAGLYRLREEAWRPAASPPALRQIEGEMMIDRSCVVFGPGATGRPRGLPSGGRDGRGERPGMGQGSASCSYVRPQAISKERSFCGLNRWAGKSGVTVA